MFAHYLNHCSKIDLAERVRQVQTEKEEEEEKETKAEEPMSTPKSLIGQMA